ncbi:hypothetical protein [Rubrivirga sp.]|uniref:hypothetical protein n=1 Tax=Rubrivirga sp. TaxID=1885344 RepID=UPI003B51E29D
MLAWSLLLVAAIGLTTVVSLVPASAASLIGLSLATLAAAAFVARPEGPRSA